MVGYGSSIRSVAINIRDLRADCSTNLRFKLTFANYRLKVSNITTAGAARRHRKREPEGIDS